MTLPKKITQSIVRSETWHIILNVKAAIKRSVLLFVMTMESITIIAMRAKSKSMRL
tara:strand:- start:109 stop:276 length:168 start_codon:yes stop_codon:yes gene_type:complete